MWWISCHLQPNHQGPVSIRKTVLPGMGIPMLKIKRTLWRLIYNMEIPIPSKTVFLVETPPWSFGFNWSLGFQECSGTVWIITSHGWLEDKLSRRHIQEEHLYGWFQIMKARYSAAQTCVNKRAGSSMVQTMAYWLFGDKPKSEATNTFCQLYHLEHLLKYRL